LLRLLLPLNDKVYGNSRTTVEGNPKTEVQSLQFTGSFIGRSDGRCVQRAGT